MGSESKYKPMPAFTNHCSGIFPSLLNLEEAISEGGEVMTIDDDDDDYGVVCVVYV